MLSVFVLVWFGLGNVHAICRQQPIPNLVCFIKRINILKDSIQTLQKQMITENFAERQQVLTSTLSEQLFKNDMILNEVRFVFFVFALSIMIIDPGSQFFFPKFVMIIIIIIWIRAVERTNEYWVRQ